MTLTEALLYLETTARVSCPQITCEQAGEIAELMRDLSDQHQVDIAEMVSWKIHAQVLYERDEALAKLRKAEREWDEARDGRDEAEDQVNTSLSRADQWHREFIRLTQQSGEFIRLTQQSERTEQTACGFAWDCGREMARLEEVMRDMDRTEKRHAREWSDLLGERDYWDSRMEGLGRQVEALKKERDEARRELAEEREAHEKTKQEACGFAWDVGAEMSRNDGYCMRRPDGTIECRRFVCHQPCAARPGAVSDVEVDASDYERPGRGRR